MPVIPVSWGELIDKITILQIKAAALKKTSAAANVRRELRLLSQVAAPALNQPAVRGLMSQLKTVNRALWKTEDAIRAKDARSEFDARFVALARSVYRTNDARAALKKQINVQLASHLFEEKSYRRS